MQRTNLRRTFAQAEETTIDPQVARRLAKAEKELAQATEEFTNGLEARSGPVPCLHDAQAAMLSAAAELERKKLQPGASFEETALADLIKARQDMRQLLKQNSSSKASEVRRFDAQQKQRLRPPPKKHDKKQTAQLQQELEKLAQEEKKLAAEMDGQSSQSQSDKDTNNEAAAQAKQKLAERQEKAADKAAELQKLMSKDDALTDLAQERMDAAAKEVQGSAKSMREGRTKEAGKQAANAAEQLERLARQVAALKAYEAAGKLAHAQRMAQQLAKEQQAMQGALQGNSKSGSNGGREATQQRGQSEEARSLEDLLNRAQQEATESDAKLGEALRQASDANPPRTIVHQMQKAAEALEAGKREQARRDVKETARMLEGLAQQLETTRRNVVQPQLEKLLAAEKQAAQTQQALKSVDSESQKTEAEKKLSDLHATMEALNAKDARLNDATAALTEAIRTGGTNWTKWERKDDHQMGAYVPPIEYEKGLHRVIESLQIKIQEIILKDALLDRDEAVPPQYKPLVEEYYRTLSDDLR
jgi:hypothetical protein